MDKLVGGLGFRGFKGIRVLGLKGFLGVRGLGVHGFGGLGFKGSGFTVT